jgi:hypothetical protein
MNESRRDSSLLKGDSSLGKDTAVKRRTSIKCDSLHCKQDPLEGRADSDYNSVTNMPKDILRKSATCEGHTCATGLREGACNLEDPCYMYDYVSMRTRELV